MLSVAGRQLNDAVTLRRLVFAAALLSILAVYLVVLAFSQETSSLAALGPHPDGGVRFYGISNQVETLLLVPGLLGAALLGASFVPVVGALVLVVVGASGLGADGGGILVPDADLGALAAAIVELLTDVELRARLTAEAVAAARAVHPEHAMAALAQAVDDVLARPSRRV